MVLPSLQQAVIHSSPPLRAHASLQLFVKPLVVYLVTESNQLSHLCHLERQDTAPHLPLLRAEG